MSRPYPGRRRRRPGRRSLPGEWAPSGPTRSRISGRGSTTDHPRHPRSRSPAVVQRRQRVVRDRVGLIGVAVGSGMAGPFGAIIGFGAGVTLGANYLTRNRYFRH